jgi:hypothetical protein
MSAAVSPLPKFTGRDNFGNIVPGGLLFTYLAGTSTQVATYQDAGLTTPNATPIVLDAYARATIFLVPGVSYKFSLSPVGDGTNSHPYWTQDNINSTPAYNVNIDVAGTCGETITIGQACYLSDGSGGKTGGRWYKGDSTNPYSSCYANIIGFALQSATVGNAGSFRIAGKMTGLSGLTIGDIYYMSTAGTITSSFTLPANNRPILVADSTSSGVMAFYFGSGAFNVGGSLTVLGQASFGGTPDFFPGTTTGGGSMSGSGVPMTGMLNVQETPVSAINGTTDMMSFTVPGGTLDTGPPPVKLLRINAHGYTLASQASPTSFDFWWNGAKVFPTLFGGGNLASQTIAAKIFIIRTGSNTQMIAGYALGLLASQYSIYFHTPSTSTATDTNPVIFKFQSVGSIAGNVVQTDMVTEVLGFA